VITEKSFRLHYRPLSFNLFDGTGVILNMPSIMINNIYATSEMKSLKASRELIGCVETS
jgi:hypothetical protein